MKINNWDLVKLKSFCIAKETIKNEKRTHIKAENICKQSEQQGISLKIYKQFMQLNIKKTQMMQSKNGQKIYLGISSKKTYRWPKST